MALAKEAEEVSKVVIERDNLKATVNRAQSLIDEARNETLKAKRMTVVETKKKLQIARDRLVATAITSNSLGEQLNSSRDIQTMEDTLNNIFLNIDVITNELTALELWDDDEEKPNVVLIKLMPVDSITKKTNQVKKEIATKKSDNGNEQISPKGR